MVAAEIADEILVQIAYAIGIAEPISIYVNTYGTSHVNCSDSEISKKIKSIFDLKPAAIIKRFNLKDPIYQPTASYGHMGRNVQKIISNWNEKEIELFPWEKLDYVHILPLN